MRILVHDYSGHPFQADLSRSLAARGHTVRHSTCVSHVSGKGDLSAQTSATLTYGVIGGRPVHKQTFWRRLWQEFSFGFELVSEIRRFRPDCVVLSNAAIPMQAVVAAYLFVARVPWLYWMQDVYSVAVESFAGSKLPRRWMIVAKVMARVERRCARSASHIVVIAEAFLATHVKWSTADKVTVIPNWAPTDEIKPVGRDNDWAREHSAVEKTTVLYSGTLGLKHNPELLVQLVDRVRSRGHDAQLVVVTEGAAVDVIHDFATRLAVPVQVLPFQPYARLSEVLGSSDVLVVLLNQSAGAFSVPSKTMSYMCAGRPILGLIPIENSAAELLKRSKCAVFAPDAESLEPAAEWIDSVLTNPKLWTELAQATRALAEIEFSLKRSTDAFEEILFRITAA